MNKMVFVSRHRPTTEQQQLAAKANMEIHHIGDRDAFTWDPNSVRGIGHEDAVAIGCVHPAIAVKAISAGFEVVVFENENRAAVGEKPDFHTTAMHVYWTDETTQEIASKTYRL